MLRRRHHARTPRLECLESRKLLTVVMSPEEQLIVELVNRARADPPAEAERYGLELNQDVQEDRLISESPKQPLAPHQALTEAAGLHSEDMLRRNYFGHNTPEGITPSDRALAAGYPVGAGENIAWAGQSNLDRRQEVYDRHRGLFESVGHRLNMMRESFREIGAGVRYGSFTQGLTQLPSIMVGTLFGNRGGDYFITGVAINDLIARNDFYDMGEGLGDLTITATLEGSDESYTEVTGPTGGYSIQVPNGIYTVTASGASLPGPFVVRGVEVDDANVKVDFNRRVMPTRYIEGSVTNQVTATGAAGHVVFLDFNDNDRLDQGEPREETNQEGQFRFDGLMPGDYDVRLDVPARHTQTFPDAGYPITITDRNIVGADFRLRSDNLPPIAIDDTATVAGGQSVIIDVLQNDFDTDDTIVPATVRVIRSPANGTVSVDGSGSIRYSASELFAGQDSFQYTVEDSDGVRSNTATATIDVTPAFPWQNSNSPLDVNNDGVVVSQDALIVIREINRTGARSLGGRGSADQAPFYDVTGDNFLSSLDVLRIIRFLNAQAAGEAPEAASPAAVDAVLALAALDREDR